MAGTVLKLYDNESNELNVGDKVIFCMNNVNRTAWLYEVRKSDGMINVHSGSSYSAKALFSMTNPNTSKPVYMGYEWVSDVYNQVRRAIKI